ncbi:hypothetical protein [Paenibacillus sp. Leaf72]|uniref:hypothetical protein n=1 Tax=Paenibacillus sp. Leaf72 TaxID=1736234 RepID=UPI0006F8FB18|nr:hypothetical protein [Paenibacillus sp. Leaf72]KQO14718.1 hypothetical protein ASF12_29045 [Paenibacillus sp. Leaf72]
MGINKKGRRKIVCNARLFYWYVQPDYDDCGQIKLNIVSDDKKWIVSYEVGQSKNPKTPHIVIKGREFEGLDRSGWQGWMRVQTPIWEDTIITPELVKTIIEWCFHKKERLIVVDWKGEII